MTEETNRQRSTRTATVVIITTIIWGGIAYATIGDILPLRQTLWVIGLISGAAFTVRAIERD